MSVSVVFIGPVLFVPSYKLTPIVWFFESTTIFICIITFLLITPITAHRTAWQLQPDSNLSPPANATTLPEMGSFYAVFRNKRILPNVLPRCYNRGPQHFSFFMKPMENNLDHWNEFMDTCMFPSWVQLKFFLWNVTSIRTSGLRQSFPWLLRFDFVLSWNSLFDGLLVVVYCMFVQVSRLEIAGIKRAG
jgi:hypothetical protein